jgi:type VI secretion system protein ImpC
MPGRMEFEFRFGTAGSRQHARPADGTPFRILVLGDFRGTAGRDPDPARGRTIAVDVDNFESVFKRLSPELEIPGGTGDGRTAVTFGSLDDFHPDALYQRLEIFRTLRTTRDDLGNPATFPLALARLGGDAGPAGAAAGVKPAGVPAPKESDDDALERLLGRPASGTRSSAAVDITGLLRELMAPYIVPEKDPRTDTLVASVDGASEGLMRTILRSSAFRSLESTWRGLHGLVTSEVCGEGVEIHVLDAPQAQLAADLVANAAALERSALGRAVSERADGPGGTPWSLVIGAWAFGPEEASLRLLAALGAVARRAGGPLVAGASPALLGCDSFAETPGHAGWAPLPDETGAAWSALRRAPDAPWIALAAPRVLMRQPYGRKSDPVERFAFEEIPPGHDHESLPWGHPGFALGQLLAASFTERGFEMEPGDHRDLGELPAHTTVKDGETVLTPCAEVFLAESTANAMLDRGVTAIVSVRNRAAVIVPRFQSIADPPAPLAGPWS